MPQPPLRTLYLARDYPPHGGGIARMHGELSRRFPAGGVQVSAPRMPGQADWDHVAGVPVHRMPWDFRRARHMLSVARWALWTRARVAREGIDLLQIGNIRPTGYIGAALRRRVPYVLYTYGLDLWKEQRRAATSRRIRSSARTILDNASAIIAISDETARIAREVLTAVGGTDRGQIHVVHLGTDPETFRPDAEGAARWRRELDLDGRPVILTVARLTSRKGIDVMLEAMAQLAPRFPDALYLVAGKGGDLPRLEKLARQLGVADRVRFLGFVEEERLPGLYAVADVFALPAREERDQDEVEGYGIVYNEAAAAGLPVIAGRSGGVEDAVREGETALLVAPTVDEVAEALGTLLGDPDLRQRMGAAGRASVLDYYNWDRAASQVWSILERVAAEHR